MNLCHVPLDQIDAQALIRDRSRPDPLAQADLVRSIETIGLRQPVELFALSPATPCPYGLISGHRRLAAFRALGRDTIPALLCTPADIPAAMAAMVTENEVRSQISPWEKGEMLVRLVYDAIFPDMDAAIAALYPAASKQSRARLRGFFRVVETLAPRFLTPEALSTAQMDRLDMALRLGGETAILATLKGLPAYTLSGQWEALRPVLNGIAVEAGEPAMRRTPRHSLTLKQGITLTREHTRTGWIIRMTGPMARSPGLVDDVFDLVERWLQPE